MPPEVAESACIHLLTRLRHFWDSRCHVLHSLEKLLTRLTALYSTFEVLGRRLPCFCRSFFWWLGFIVFFRTRGCMVASALLACCALTGTAPLDIFGPTFVVYFLRGWTSRERGSNNPGSLREYIGLTERHEDERKQEHMSRAKNKGAMWLGFVELEGDPVVLYQTKSEAKALLVEMFAVLWRYRRKKPFCNGAGGVVRGAWFLRHHLQQPELKFIALALEGGHGADAMPVLPCLRDDEIPSRLCITEQAVDGATQWLESEPVERHRPADLERHLDKGCFQCRRCAVPHLSRDCPKNFTNPAAGRYVEPAVAAAVAPAPRRAAPGQGLQRNYHRNPAFRGTIRCGDPGAEYPAPCHFVGERCSRCFRCDLNNARTGGRKKRKHDVPKCNQCASFNAADECTVCFYKRKKRRDEYPRAAR